MFESEGSLRVGVRASSGEGAGPQEAFPPDIISSIVVVAISFVTVIAFAVIIGIIIIVLGIIIIKLISIVMT